MANDSSFIEFVLEQIEYPGELQAKAMFGGHTLYADGKIFALICDNKLFIKPTDAGRSFIGEVTEAPPFPGAKNSFLIEEKLEDREWLSKLVRITQKALPEPKKRKK